MTKRRWMSLAIAVAVVVALPLGAGATGYEWRNHDEPFAFEFGNHIDTHQQSKANPNERLTGFLYITPSGESDEAGTPIVGHGDCTMDPDACTVGWGIKGIAMEATYCGHVSGEHPAWAIDPDAMPEQLGFTHFHWLNETPHHDGLMVGEPYDGYLLKLTAVDTFIFGHHGEFLVRPGIDLDTHFNVYPTCEDWPHFGGGDGHDH